ncbi:hypothetical protein MUO98_06565 [Candidatus Bathyarchaeota archaeon]|nr:hypothetical protein [Candidatus Bathyarchaeota archaeon]
MNDWKNTIRALGITTCLIGAFLMAFGEPILGTTHTGVATVVGITGIGIITVAKKTSFLGKKKWGK